MAPVFPWLTRLNCKRILANLASNCPGGFPIAHLLALFHAGTGMVLHLLAAPLRTHDLSRVVALHPDLRPSDVLVADRGFCSYPHLALLVKPACMPCSASIRSTSWTSPQDAPCRAATRSRKATKDSRAPDGSDSSGTMTNASLGANPWPGPWMEAEQFAHLPDRLAVRELQYRVHRKGFRVTRITLVTTLLDAACYTVAALAQLYYARWGIETNFAHLKTTMGLDVLKCKTVDGVLKELIVFALIYNLVRLVMAQAARHQHVAIDRISFMDAARWLAAAHDDESLSWLVVHPPRPGRYEPRVRKRRPKQYPLMQKPRQPA